ncbi:MAG: glutamine synthetase family protein [Eubacterium sp.]|nr:glutamine synthetase family protein [Eubacterium sp.]
MTKSEIMQIIEDEGVEFIRLQFTDIYGILKNVAVTPGQMEKVFLNKYSFESSAVFGGVYPYEERLYLYPDLDTFMLLPWRPQQGKVAKLFCDIYMEDGQPFEMSSRRILKKVLKEANKEGYSVIANPECEFFLFHTDENGLPTTMSHDKAGYMDVGPVDFGENARRDIVLMLEEMGFNIESSHHEHAPAQHEIDFQAEEGLRMADAIQTFRFAVRSIAKRFGLYATFMPKPKEDVAGSSMHTHLIIRKEGKNIFRDSQGNPSQEAYHFVGGILKHAKALVAIGNPCVNSYKRLLLGFEAPNRINWGSKGEKSFVKINKCSGDVTVELRFPDGSCNPYLLFACCLKAGMEGVNEKIDPGKDISTLEGGADLGEKLPGNLKEAVDALKEDSLMTSFMGQEFTDIYAELKYREWDEYMRAVSDWEVNRYLTRI